MVEILISLCVSRRSKRCRNARRTTFELNAPHKPRSDVMATISILPPFFDSGRATRSGWGASPICSARRATAAAVAAILSANGRAAFTRSSARRSLAAETIFMALVIFCVFFTLLMRLRMSRSEAMSDLDRLALEDLLELGQGRFEALGDLETTFGPRQIDLLAGVVADVVEDAGVLRLQEVDELLRILCDLALLVLAHPRVLRARLRLRRRIDEHDLLLDGVRLVLPLLEELHEPL